VVVVLLVVGGGGGSGSTSSTTTAAGAGTAPVVLSAANRGTVDWGPQCDVARGTVAVPLTYAPPCVAPFRGDNGGATAPGVTGDTITVALYQAQPDVLQQTFFQQSGSDASLTAEAATVQQYVDFFESHYETYGRHVKVVVVRASGAPDDEQAAKADAIKVATQIHAFASWGGPGQTAAYAEELAARGVLCLGDCMITATDQFARARHNSLWLTFASIDQLSEHWAQFITRELVGNRAVHAGDPALRKETRVFGVVRFDESFAGLDQAGASFVKKLRAKGVKIATEAPYQLDLSKAQENARSVIAKLKAAKVTTVIFAGDPITPASLTQEATAQSYFPEWVVLGAAYTDTSLFGRTYDQRQWAHAFGVSSLPVPLTPAEDQLYDILVWQTGHPPDAKTFKVLVQAPLIFYTGLHLAGPDLTPASFRAGLFRFPSGPTNPTDIHLSWGDHGIWPSTDLFGTDDTTLIWWNPEATGLDEVGNAGKGLWEYSQGGRRYLPGQWPRGQPDVFDPSTSVTSYTTPPPGARPPRYPSPASG
jgi:ABC-type branched-subunit amino acid transport system substrate-binding protein